MNRAYLEAKRDKARAAIAFAAPGADMTFARATLHAAERHLANLSAQPFATELTPAGEQTVIPGCERNTSPRAKQLDLFG